MPLVEGERRSAPSKVCRMRIAVLLSLAVWLHCGALAEPVPPYPTVPTAEIDSQRERNHPFFLDVRSAQELAELGTLEGYYHIPLDELEDRLDELPRDRPILTA